MEYSHEWKVLTEKGFDNVYLTRYIEVDLYFDKDKYKKGNLVLGGKFKIKDDGEHVGMEWKYKAQYIDALPGDYECMKRTD